MGSTSTDEIRFQKTLLEAQSEASPDGILVVDQGGDIIFFNRRFAEMWGIPDEVLGSRSDEAAIQAVLDGLEDPDAFRAKIAYLYEHPEETSRDELRLRDGRVFDRYSAPVRSDDGHYHGRVWYFRDVTTERHYEQQLRTSRERADFLAEASRLLSSSLDYRETLTRLARLAVPRLADWCVIDMALPDGSPQQIEVAHVDPVKVDLARRLREEFPPDPQSPYGSAEVIRTGMSQFFSEIPAELLQEIASGPRHLEMLEALGLRAALIVPLAARGRTFGAITMVTAESGRIYEPEDLQLAEDLAGRAALAVDNALLYGEREHVARTLQKTLLPPVLPIIPGLRIAARYLPASRGMEVGGDFYDVFQNGHGGWAMVIGDVCGKGVEAASLTALARHTVRAAAMTSEAPDRVLEILNEAIMDQQGDGRFCTAVYAKLHGRPDGFDCTLARGGHPPPLIVHRDGTVDAVGRAGTLLGLFDDPMLTSETLQLGHGDTLFLYTDGVTDAGPANDPFGEKRLKELLASCAAYDVETMARRIESAITGLQGTDVRDDTAFLLVQVDN